MAAIAAWMLALGVGLLPACTVPSADPYEGPDAPVDQPTTGPQPVVVADADDGLDHPAALAVNATAIFWTESARIRSCPLPSGCTREPELIADAYTRLSAIAVTDDAVYFAGCKACAANHELRRCSATGCPEILRALVTTNGRYDEILIGPTHAYWREGTAALLGCEHTDCARTGKHWPASHFGGPLVASTIDGDTLYAMTAGAGLRTCVEATGCDLKKVVANSSNIEPPFRVHDRMAYWFASGPGGAVVRRCWVGNCGSGSTFADDDHGSTEIEVDDSGVYWMNPVAGTIRHCPLTGCPTDTGPTLLVSQRTGLKALTLGAGFVYWIESNTIFKMAKEIARP